VLFIIGPFLVVGWISSYKASDTMKDEVAKTMLQLVKQNHAAMTKTLASVRDKSVTFLDNQFFSSASQFDFWTHIETIGDIREADTVLERWSSDGTDYSLYMNKPPGKELPLDMRYKLKGFIQTDPGAPNYPVWAGQTLEEKGGGTVRLVKIGSGPPTVSLTRSILHPSHYNESIGFLIITKLEVLLMKDLVSVQLPEHAGIYLFNDQDELLMQSTESSLSLAGVPEPVRSEASGYYWTGQGNNGWLYAYSHDSAYNTRLIYKIPMSSITGRQDFFQWMIIGMSAVYMMFVLVFVLYLMRSIVKPMARLVRFTKVYEPGKKMDFGDRPSGPVEFGMLYESFIRMTGRLDQLVEENYVMNLQQKEVELSTLHSQITPHLLYNTLDSIYWYAVDSGNMDVSSMVKDLSKLLRIGLSKGKRIITVGEELEHIQAYVRLQMKRYPGVFQVHWDVDESLQICLVPKVVIQPLVENAIFHGVNSMDGEGEIWIRLRREGEELHITVEDNGFLPVDLEKLEQILSGGLQDKGYGIRNVHQRVVLHFGKAYGLRYRHREEGGLTAVITLPFTTGE
jgi:two-component system, sensor histidine kinase YesM